MTHQNAPQATQPPKHPDPDDLSKAHAAYTQQSKALEGVRVPSVLVGPHPDNPGPGYSRLCMVCQQRPGRGDWPLCKKHEPEPWWRHVIRRIRRE